MEKAKMIVEFRCTCGAKASVCENEKGDPLLFHADPPCEAFMLDRPSWQYLRECQRSISIRAIGSPKN